MYLGAYRMSGKSIARCERPELARLGAVESPSGQSLREEYLLTSRAGADSGLTGRSHLTVSSPTDKS